MRKSLVKNLLVFGVSTLLCIIFLNYAALRRFEILEMQLYPPIVLAKLSPYMDKAHHFRDKEFYEDSFESLVFSWDLKSSTILLGDSWVERIAAYKGEKNLGAALIFQKNIQEVPLNGGIGSFSPTLMQGWLEYMSDNYEISFNKAIIYIDQTDFGDEIVRYREVLDPNVLRGGKVFFDRVQRASDSWHNQVNLHQIVSGFSENQNLLGWIKFEYEKLMAKSQEKTKHPSFSEITGLLKSEPSQIDKEYFKSRLKALYDRLVSMGVKKLVFASHPHLGHFQGDYVFDVGNLVSEFGKENRDLFSRDDVQVCSGRLAPSGYDLKDVFYDPQVDPGSHLQPVFQSQKFPEALASVSRECFASKVSFTEFDKTY